MIVEGAAKSKQYPYLAGPFAADDRSQPRRTERNLVATLTSLGGSAWLRGHGTAKARQILATWPRRRPSGWLAQVNRARSPPELAALRRSVHRGAPFGDPQ